MSERKEIAGVEGSACGESVSNERNLVTRNIYQLGVEETRDMMEQAKRGLETICASGTREEWTTYREYGDGTTESARLNV